MENQLRFDKKIFSAIHILLAAVILLLLFGEGRAQVRQTVTLEVDGAPAGRTGCPHCTHDGSRFSQLLVKADALYAQFKSQEALDLLLQALELKPNDHETLSKIARCHIDLGDMVPESGRKWKEKKLEHYRIAEEYGQKAIIADKDSTWGYFYVATSLGKIATYSPIHEKIDLAKEVKEYVEKAIAKDPNNGFAYHVYGVWHREVADIGRMKRFLASLVYWRSLPRGSLEKSVEYLNHAISLNPTVIVHHFELAETYIELKKWELARISLLETLKLPIQFSDDLDHKRKARRLLEKINNRQNNHFSKQD